MARERGQCPSCGKKLREDREFCSFRCADGYLRRRSEGLAMAAKPKDGTTYGAIKKEKRT